MTGEQAKQVVAALIQLAKALPDVDSIVVGLPGKWSKERVSLWTLTDGGAQALAAAFGATLQARPTVGVGSSTQRLECDLTVNDIEVSIVGPAHPLPEAAGEKAVAAALISAAEALAAADAKELPF